MKKFACVIGLLVTCAGSPRAGRPPQGESLTAQQMARIEALVVDLTAPSDLFRSKEFVAIYEDPLPNKGRVLAFLARGDVTDTRKMIAAYAMQKLPLYDYLAFLDEVYKLCESKSVSPAVFELAAFPSYDWNTYFAGNYEDEKVRALLVKIKRSGFVSVNWQRYIDRALAGEAGKDVRELRRTGQLRP